MVFNRRDYHEINYILKILIIIITTVILTFSPIQVLAGNISPNDSMISSNIQQGDVLQGSVSVDIVPYCSNWSSQYAFNKINTIGTKLIQANNLEQHMQFIVVEDEEANASTNINNVIAVNLGLLKYVETEDELAFVIGHEMGHVTKNHVRKSIARNAILTTAGFAGSALTVLGIINDSAKMTKSGAIITGSALAGGVANKSLSRGQETKSDFASVDYMVNAGYNPLATISILNKISGNYFDFFSDHPSGEKRIKKVYKYIKNNYPEYIDQGYKSTSYERALKIINE